MSLEQSAAAERVPLVSRAAYNSAAGVVLTTSFLHFIPPRSAVYPTSTKETETISLEALAAICRATALPVVSIGGITAANAGSHD